MTSTRQAESNSRNAARSTGPRSTVGKNRSKFNALSHGLASTLYYDVSRSKDVDRLSRLIVGADSDQMKIASARNAAEAEFDLLRVLEARVALLRKISKDRSNYIPQKFLFRWVAFKQVLGAPSLNEQFSHMQKILDARFPPQQEREVRAVECAIQILAKMDRYEQRALSRRNKAFRHFDAICSQSVKK